ncbi:4-hydroxy-3-methylbut-2-enyl diphosphate reductase, partial [Candidatus Gastranaerophilus sp. (ex Termes propinquus)]
MTQITQKNIKLASHAGFCYGVKRAVETTKRLKCESPEKNIYVLGELIHNSQVIKELEDLGILTVESLPENTQQSSSICIIRSHGASGATFEEIKNKGYELTDLTCPDVKKAQNKAIELVRSGCFLIILGEPQHPEVAAIEANARQAAFSSDEVFVANNIEALQRIEDIIKKQEKIGVVVQTTQRLEYLKEVLNWLLPISRELRIVNTICASTSLRMNEAKVLAEESDLMIVVGSKKSANTTH